MRQPLLLAAALGLATTALAQPGRPTPPPAAKAPNWSVRYAARITPTELRADLSVLASDEYEGRATGQPGQRRAADYLAKAFAAAGLAGPVRGAENPYFQRFTINRTGLNPAASAQIGGRTFELHKDFHLALRNPAAATATVLPTFVGYGISTAGYQDFAPAAPDLKDKDVLLLLGEPLTPAGQPLLGAASAYGTAGYPEMAARSPALRTLVPHSSFRIAPSAAAFAEVPQAYPGLFANAERLALPGDPDPAPEGINLFVVSPEMGAAMLGTTPAGVAQYRQAVAAAGRPVASPFAPVPVALQVGQRVPFQTENVLGYLEGSDKKEEVVVVSAHYDHVGVQHGAVYNGADDDGSGTVSVLAMARAFAQAKRDGHGPRRSLLFLASTAEEVGLLGSRYYVEHPVFPLANTVADLNIDMLGRVDSLHQGRGDYVYVLGDNWRSPDLRPLGEATNQHYQPLALDYTYNNIMSPEHLYRRSDQYSFAERGVPVIFYTSGLHADYHQPTDDVAKIDFPALARRSQLIFRTAWALANRAARPALAAPAPTASYVPAAADLARYAGTYASPATKLKITLTPTGPTLRAQASDQQTFPLEPARPGVFEFAPIGLRLEFAADKPEFTLRQGDSNYVFTKQVG